MNLVNAVVPLVRRGGRFVTRNASHILMAMATGESILALIFAVKAAPDANQAIADKRVKKAEIERKETGEEIVPLRKLTFGEWISAVWKYYGPAAAMELLSLICFWAAHGIDIRRQAVLAGLCKTVEEALREYQRKVQEMIGKESEKEIRNAQALDQVEKNPPPTNTYFLESDSEQWFIYEGQYFRSSYNKIKEAQNMANHEMIQHMYISEMELMWLLDPEKRYLKPDSESGQVGWSVDNMLNFEINWVPNENHRPVGVLEVTDTDGFKYRPSPGFSRLM